MADAQTAPAAARNREPLLEVFRPRLRGLVLEVASGTGEHAMWFAQALPELVWQPSECDEARRASIAAWRDEADAANLRPPLALDAGAPNWPIAHADAVVAVNLLHIAPWAVAEGLFAGAARVLSAGAPLILYGPFIDPARPTAASNCAFDMDLRARDPAWGLRSLAEIDALGRRHGLSLAERIDMPANNMCLVFRRR